MKKLPSVEKLVAALETESPETLMSFREDSDPENLYGLFVGAKDDQLQNNLALLFGCSENESDCSEFIHFEVSPDWHGRGRVNMRDLADEFIYLEGEFFDFSITVAELRSLAFLSRNNTAAMLVIPKFRSDWDTIHPGTARDCSRPA